MKIKTELLQKMVAKAIQGASNNKTIPITSLIGIEVTKSDNLILTTTDGSNQLKVSNKIERDDFIPPQNFYTIVNAGTFAKLVGKTTKEFIELENKENYLEVRGNGTYKLEIAINEEGEMVKFPVIKNIEGSELSVNLNSLQNAIKIAKASVAKTIEVPCLTGYYIAKNMITTDKEMICVMENNLVSEPILISSEIAELLLLVDGDDVLNFIKKDNDLIFYNNNYTIAGKELEGKENYPVQQIINLASTEYQNTVRVNRQELLAILDRMSLFVTDYDKGGIYLTFGKDGLIVRSQKSNAEEIINITADTEPSEFTCLIVIDMLKAQLETLTTDEVTIAYGQDKSIKIIDNDIIHIISLVEKQ